MKRVNFHKILQLLKRTFSKWSDDKAPRLGAALAYYTILSLAPLLIVILAILSLAFGSEAAHGQIVWQIEDLVGKQGAEAIQTMIKNAQKPTTGVLASILGIITLFLGASGVFGELRDALNTIWGAKPAGASGLVGIFRERFLSFGMVLAIGFLLLVSLVLSAFLAVLGKYFGGLLPIPEFVLHAANFLFSFAVITAVFALIYKFFPDAKIAWDDVRIGAAATALLFTLGKFLIGLYLGKASIGSAYGAAGSLVIVLVWVYYSAQIFFFGAEFTQVYAREHGSHAAKANEVNQQETGQAAPLIPAGPELSDPGKEQIAALTELRPKESVNTAIGLMFVAVFTGLGFWRAHFTRENSPEPES